MKCKFGIFIFVSSLLTCCSFHQDKVSQNSGLDISGIDKKVSPKNDFYKYANGNWLEVVQIDNNKNSISNFSILKNRVERRVASLIKDIVEDSSENDPIKKKISDLYQSFMDTKTIDELGIKPILTFLNEIKNIANEKQLFTLLGGLASLDINTPIYLNIAPDIKEPSKNIVHIHQNGLTLPDKKFYLLQTKEYKKIRQEMMNYIITVLKEINYNDPQGAAERILAFETKLAENHSSINESNDLIKNYNKISTKKIKEMLNFFDWSSYINAIYTPKFQQAIVHNLPYFEKLGYIAQTTDLRIWRDYLTFQVINQFATQLPKKFDAASFNFFHKTLKGIQTQKQRWTRSVDFTSYYLDEIIGKIYIEKYFSPEEKKHIETLVKNINTSYEKSILSNDWMSNITKSKAIKKLKYLNVKVGYPKKFETMDEITLNKEDLIGNKIKIITHYRNKNFAKISKPVDTSEWNVSPLQVNTYYHPTQNEIIVPAGILQPPFFIINADGAINYGAIGTVLAHALSHAFDYQGAYFDAHGKFQRWWTHSDFQNFKNKTLSIAKQYSQFEPIEKYHINGDLTLHENISDIAGVKNAYQAYLISLEGQQAPIIDNYTGTQRFFISFAQSWKIKYQQNYLQDLLIKKNYVPGKYRVLGTLKNINEFYKAFDINLNDGMYIAPQERLKLW